MYYNLKAKEMLTTLCAKSEGMTLSGDLHRGKFSVAFMN